MQSLTVHHTKGQPRQGGVSDTADVPGSNGRLRSQDCCVAIEALSPGEIQDGARGLEIRYGFAPGPFGEVLIAHSPRGLCLLALVDAATRDRELHRLQALYPHADRVEDPGHAVETAASLFAVDRHGSDGIRLAVRGTRFQVDVWRALLRIPAGAVVSYQHLARGAGVAHAVRAVANAVAANPVHLLIPCHRVIRADGSLGGFRAGLALKARLLAAEGVGRK